MNNPSNLSENSSEKIVQSTESIDRTVAPTMEEISALREKNETSLSDIKTQVSTLRRQLDIYVPAVEDTKKESFVQVMRDLASLERDISLAMRKEEKSAKQFTEKLESISSDLQNILQELRSATFNWANLEKSMASAKTLASDGIKVSTKEKQITDREFFKDTVIEDTSEKVAHLAEEKDEQNTDEQNIAEENLPSWASQVEEIRNLNLRDSESFRTSLDEIKQEEVLENQDSVLAQYLDPIHSESEPKTESKLLRQIWSEIKNNMGTLKNVEKSPDNQGLLFTFKNGVQKLVKPSALERFSGRSLSAFKEKHLDKVEAFTPETKEMSFLTSENSEESNEKKPSETASKSGYEDLSAVNVFKKGGPIIS